MNRVNYFFVTICCFFTIFSVAVAPVVGSSGVNIVPPGGTPYNSTYADHAKNFWIWILGIPGNENPVNDPTGINCANGQSNSNSSVFYLAFNNGGKSVRSCEVPAGKALFIPVMQAEYSDKEVPGATVDQLSTSVDKDQDSVNEESLYLKIGDKEYSSQDLSKYRIHTDDFQVLFPDNGIFGVKEGGPSKVVADGYYIITEPLTKGTYPVHFRSSLTCSDPGCAEPNFAQDIQYTIIAK